MRGTNEKRRNRAKKIFLIDSSLWKSLVPNYPLSVTVLTSIYLIGTNVYTTGLIVVMT